MMRVIAPFIVLMVAACAETEDPAEPVVADCGAAGYQAMVGAQLAAVTLPAGLNMDIVEFGAAPPSPADPSRMLFQLDAEGRIVRVYCG